MPAGVCLSADTKINLRANKNLVFKNNCLKKRINQSVIINCVSASSAIIINGDLGIL